MMEVKAGLSGKYFIDLTNVDTGVTRRVGAVDGFDNKLLTSGLNNLGNLTGPLSVCVVGTGNSTPTSAQSQLDNLFATSVSSSAGGSTNNTTNAPYTATSTTVFTFAQGATTGNLTEVGVGFATNNLLSRTLIKDGGGNPTTISPQANEILTVTYAFTVTLPMTQSSSSISINGTPYTVLASAALAGQWSAIGFLNAINGLAAGGTNAYDGVLGDVTTSPSGATYPADGNVQRLPYVNNSMRREYTMTIGTANYTGTPVALQSFLLAGWQSAFYFQYQFSPTFAKDNTNQLSLTFFVSWSANLGS